LNEKREKEQKEKMRGGKKENGRKRETDKKRDKFLERKIDSEFLEKWSETLEECSDTDSGSEVGSRNDNDSESEKEESCDVSNEDVPDVGKSVRFLRSTSSTFRSGTQQNRLAT
jgi:hypothetical protein